MAWNGTFIAILEFRVLQRVVQLLETKIFTFSQLFLRSRLMQWILRSSDLRVLQLHILVFPIQYYSINQMLFSYKSFWYSKMSNTQCSSQKLDCFGPIFVQNFQKFSGYPSENSPENGELKYWNSPDFSIRRNPDPSPRRHKCHLWIF